MANSTTNLDTIAVGQAGKETTANELFDAASPAMAFGRHGSACSGLTWAYYGGVVLVGGAATTIANGTLSLTASDTNYVERTQAGVVSVNLVGFTAGSVPLYTVVTGTASATSWTDHRLPPSLPWVPTVTDEAASATITLDASAYDIYDITLEGALTLDFSNGTDGRTTIVRFRQDSTGSRILTLGTSIRVSASVPDVVLSTAGGSLDYVAFRYCADDAVFDVMATNLGFV